MLVVDVDADVALGFHPRLPGVHTDPHAWLGLVGPRVPGECALRVYRRRDAARPDENTKKNESPASRPPAHRGARTPRAAAPRCVAWSSVSFSRPAEQPCRALRVREPNVTVPLGRSRRRPMAADHARRTLAGSPACAPSCRFGDGSRQGPRQGVFGPRRAKLAVTGSGNRGSDRRKDCHSRAREPAPSDHARLHDLPLSCCFSTRRKRGYLRRRGESFAGLTLRLSRARQPRRERLGHGQAEAVRLRRPAARSRSARSCCACARAVRRVHRAARACEFQLRLVVGPANQRQRPDHRPATENGDAHPQFRLARAVYLLARRQEKVIRHDDGLEGGGGDDGHVVGQEGHGRIHRQNGTGTYTLRTARSASGERLFGSRANPASRRLRSVAAH